MGTANLRLNTAKKDGWICPLCGQTFRVRRYLEVHKKEVHNVSKSHPTYEKCCPFCKKSWMTTNSGYANHIKNCEMNPNHVSGFRKGKCHSEESKKKISEARKKYLNEHPDKVPFKLNHSSKESYPEKYFREWLQKEGIFSEREYQVNRYTLDFAWPEKGFYLEIDGSQHDLDWMKEHDIERTNFLTEKGWVCIARISWSHFCSFNNDERILFLKNLKNTILTSEVFHDFKSEREILQKEQFEYREELVKCGKVNSLGRPCSYMISTDEWEIRKNNILSSGIDLSKFGWKIKVQKATGLTRRQVDLTINKFYKDFENLIFIRK